MELKKKGGKNYLTNYSSNSQRKELLKVHKPLCK